MFAGLNEKGGNSGLECITPPAHRAKANNVSVLQVFFQADFKPTIPTQHTHTRNSLGFCSGGTGWRHFGPPVGLLFVRYILRASSGSVRINKRGDESQVFESRPRCLVPHTRAHALVCLERWWRTAKQVCGKRRQRTRPGMTTKKIKYKEKDQLPL